MGVSTSRLELGNGGFAGGGGESVSTDMEKGEGERSGRGFVGGRRCGRRKGSGAL